MSKASFEESERNLAAHDTDNWSHEPGYATDLHNTHHLHITAGRLSRHLERIEDQAQPQDAPLEEDAVADLIIYAMRYARNHEIDLLVALEDRIRFIRERAADQAGPGTS